MHRRLTATTLSNIKNTSQKHQTSNYPIRSISDKAIDIDTNTIDINRASTTSNANTMILDHKNQLLDLYKQWRDNKAMMVDEPNPSIRIPITPDVNLDLLFDTGYHIKAVEAEAWDEMQATPLPEMGEKIGGGSNGSVFLLDNKKPMVVKMVSSLHFLFLKHFYCYTHSVLSSHHLKY